LKIKYIDEDQDLSKFIRKRRIDLNMSQTELADLSGLSKNGIAKFERGESSLSFSNVMRLAPNLGFRIGLDVEPID